MIMGRVSNTMKQSSKLGQKNLPISKQRQQAYSVKNLFPLKKYGKYFCSKELNSPLLNSNLKTCNYRFMHSN